MWKPYLIATYNNTQYMVWINDTIYNITNNTRPPTTNGGYNTLDGLFQTKFGYSHNDFCRRFKVQINSA